MRYRGRWIIKIKSFLGTRSWKWVVKESVKSLLTGPERPSRSRAESRPPTVRTTPLFKHRKWRGGLFINLITFSHLSSYQQPLTEHDFPWWHCISICYIFQWFSRVGWDLCTHSFPMWQLGCQDISLLQGLHTGNHKQLSVNRMHMLYFLSLHIREALSSVLDLSVFIINH